MSHSNTIHLGGNNRREFITNCAALASLPLLASLPVNAFAAGTNDFLKIGLVGAGGRGLGAAKNALAADKNVRITAIGDIFADVIANRYVKDLLGKTNVEVPPEKRFSGFDAYKKVIDSGVDIVILATPPQFRPIHIEYAIEKGVHVFAEKPVAVDPAGVRRVIAAAEVATKKKLSIVAGTQRRHDVRYIETLRRIKEGTIGELVGGQAYWVGGSTDSFWPHRIRKPEWTEMEYQLRNWYAFQWLCGDHIVEQHVHNLDVINWAFGGPPVKAFGMGGRQNRTWGDIWDHFTVEFEYANGARVQSMCRQVNGTSTRVSERIVGTKGVANGDRGSIFNGKTELWKFSGPRQDPYVSEHANLIASIRNRTPINEGKTLAEATLTGILGRLSAYTGKEVNFKWVLEASKLDLSPSAHDFNGIPPTIELPIVPGSTRLV
jgi:predicted dehydrogenase